MFTTSSIVTNLSQEGFIALSNDLRSALESINSTIEQLNSTLSLARAISSIGYTDTAELIEEAINGLTSARADITEALSCTTECDSF